jgi:hypothetical protein
MLHPSSHVAKAEKEESEAEVAAILSDARSPCLLMSARVFAQHWLHHFSQVREPGVSLRLLPPWRPTTEELFSALADVALEEERFQIWLIAFASAWNRIGIVHYKQAPRSRWSLLEM